MKKIKILASIDKEEEDIITFSVQKTKDISLVEILGLLRVITDEVKQNLKTKIKIEKNG